MTEVSRGTPSWRDGSLFEHIELAVRRRPLRALLMGSAAALGLGTLSFAVVLAASASRAVLAEFDTIGARAVTFVTDLTGHRARADLNIAGLADLAGVVQVGVLSPVGSHAIAVNPAPWSQDPLATPVVGFDKGAVEALELVVDGTGFTAVSYDFGAPVAILGEGIVAMNDEPLVNGSPISIDGLEFLVVGVIRESPIDPGLLFSAAVPARTADRWWADLSASTRIVARVEPGAADFVAEHGALLLDPEEPDLVTAFHEPQPEAFRTKLVGNLDAFLIYLGIGLILASVAITSAFAVNDTVQRRSEIGLRRALGASRSRIAAQFVGEAVLISALAGSGGVILGGGLAVWTTIGREWVPVVPPLMAGAGPVLAAMAGALGSAIPALRAARLDPVVALRSL